MWFITMTLFWAQMSPAAAPKFITGPRAEVLLVDLMNAGAPVDCSRGLCAVNADNVNCDASACNLSVRVESGQSMTVRLNEDLANGLRESLAAAGATGDPSSISCLFARHPDEQAFQSQCLLQD